jgi:hypothetical protein
MFMPGASIISGHARKVLISRVASEVTQGSSANFGQFDVGKYSRLTGFVDPGTGSATLRIRFAINSGGPWSVSSTQVYSTVGIVDALNVARFVGLSFSAVQSTAQYSLIVFGEPLR